MRLERIFAAAINDVRAGRLSPHCGDMPTWIKADDPLNEVQWADGYAEPGYQDPDKGILFANWNQYPSKLTDVLERAGYAIEWSDEWTTCEDCNKAFRTSPDSYGWQMSGLITEDGSCVCADCVDWSDEIERYEDEPRMAVRSYVNPGDFGYVRLSESKEYESGFHPGQTDDPTAILAALHKQGKTRIVFRIADVGQFDVRFETWIKASEYEVIAGNVGTVYSGTDEQEAIGKYESYVTDSQNGYGRVAGETVTLLKDGDIVREHGGTVDEDEDGGTN